MSLYKELAARLKADESKIIPRVLQILADETDAKILLALPANAPDLSVKFELPVREIESRLHELYLRGVAFPSKKTSPPIYRFAIISAIHLHDMTVQWKKAPQEFLDLWQEWIETEHREEAEKLYTKDKKPPNRLLPANISIESTKSVMHFENVKEMVDKASTLAVLTCCCRLKARKCDHPLEVCISLNKAADYNIERGTGRKIDAKEAMEIFRKCEEEGLVHFTVQNSQDEPVSLLCNCCPCCCVALPLLIRGIPLVDPSRFRSEIDPEKCDGCGICRDRCYFGAIQWNEKEDVPVVLNEKCMGCGLCRVKCPADAITMVEARGTDFIPKIGPSLY